MNFGMNLILSLTDNASSGMQRAVDSLTQLTEVANNANNSFSELVSLGAFSATANSFGSTMTGIGMNIISMFQPAIGTINETGRTMQYAEVGLSKLYEGSGKKGKDVLADIKKKKKKSIFEFENLIPVVQMLKANGIEAFEELQLSTGESVKLMDLAADLAAFNPQMHNAYGTGIQAAMGAFSEYIAEGNARSLKSGASLDITGLLGEDKGKTIEERTQQIVRLMEQLNMVGMVSNLAGTPTQMLSNMGDVLFDLKAKISESGVYEAISELIGIFAEWVFSIPDEELQQIANTIGGALSTLMKPVIALAHAIVPLLDAFKNLVANNSGLAKFVTIALAVSGALLVVGGVAFKLLATFGYMSLMISTLGSSWSVISKMMMTGVTKLMGILIPLTLAIGLLYLAWKTDFAGIRTNLTWFVGSLRDSFAKAREATNGGVQSIIDAMSSLNTKESFFDGLTLALMRLFVLWQALSEGWNNYTLSDETFEKARELGILPLIEAIFDLKYRFENFAEGFVQGWEYMNSILSSILSGIGEAISDVIGGTIFESFLEDVTSFLQLLSTNDASAWQDLGRVLGSIAPILIILAVGFKTLSPIISFLSSVFTTFIGVVKGVFSFLSGTAGGVAMVVVGAFMAVLNFLDMLRNGFDAVKEAFMLLGIALATVGAIILAPVTATGALIIAAIGAVIAIVATLVIVIKEHFNEIVNFLAGVGNTIVTVATTAWDTLLSTISNIITGIQTFIFTTAESIGSKLSETWSNIQSSVTSSVSSIQSSISGAFNSALSTITSVMDKAKSIVQSGIDKLSSIFSGADLSLPHIDLPHFSISGSFSLDPPSIPHIGVKWYAKGGVFNKPSIIGVGESGREAVMPLENNTKWIGELAGMLVDNISTLTPKAITSNSGNSTSNVVSGDTINHNEHYDNSVTFEKGAIQVIVQNASREEAERLAEMIIELIKRKQQVTDMFSYA